MTRDAIAIVGMGCRFPGGIVDAQTMWQRMRDATVAVSDVPADRGWDLGQWYDPDRLARGRTYTKRGAFLDDIAGFDPRFFGLSHNEAAAMDPQQRLFLEVVWETLADAGIAPASLAGSRTGVFAGALSNEYLHMSYQGDPAGIDAHTVTGNIFSIIAGRVSYLLKLTGPSMALETACSSSLLAVHLACQSLLAGESDYALAGGVNLMLLPEGFVLLSRTGALSPDGMCKTFDADADGYGRGEGCGVVLLQRLSDARKSNARILAVIVGTAVTQDGGGGGLTAPNPAAQTAVIRQALRQAGIAPSDIGYLEAHGTGTVLGDPIEIRAAGAALGEGRRPDNPLAIGSVKANIGHAEAAAGIAGLIRAMLCLQYETIPPHANLSRQNPYLDLAAIPAVIPTTAMAWRRGATPRYCSISAFGFTGTNVHVILGEAPPVPSPDAAAPMPAIVPISAHSANAAQQTLAAHSRHLAAHPEHTLATIARTAAAGRGHFAWRRAIVAFDRFELESALVHDRPALSAARPPRIGFLFSGQGSQWSGAGRELYATEPVFAQVIDRCAAVLRGRREVSLADVLFEPAATPLLARTEWTQPALFALECALTELWKSWGIHPAAVLGHSVGQYAAAYAAGCMTLEDGVALMEARGRLMQGSEPGAMLALGTTETEAAMLIAPHQGSACIAALNGPRDIVISGDSLAIESIAQAAEAAGIWSRRLGVSRAFHSPLMDPLLDEFEAEAGRYTWNTPWIALVSDTTGALFEQGAAPGARLWREHARQPVRFSDALRTLSADGIDTYLEIGPGATLLGVGRRAGHAPQAGWLGSLSQGVGGRETMLRSLANLYERGADVDWTAFHAPYPAQAVSLPAYQFERKHCWVSVSPIKRSSEDTAAPLVGKRIASPLRSIQYERIFNLASLPFLADTAGLVHIGVYCEMLLQAAFDQWGASGVDMLDFTVEEALVIDAGQQVPVQVVLEPTGSRAFSACIYSGETRGWRRHCRTELHLQPDGMHARPVAISNTDYDMPASEFYAWLRDSRGMDLGPSVQWIDAVQRGSGSANCRMRANTGPGAYRLGVHPGFVDACLQMFYAALPSGESDSLFLFSSARRIGFAGQLSGGYRGRLWLEQDMRVGGLLIGSLAVGGEAGTVAIEMDGVEMRQTGRDVLDRLAARAKSVAPVSTGPQLLEFAAGSLETRRRVAEAVLRAELSSALGEDDIDPATPLTQLGLDSIVAMELRAAVMSRLGADVPTVTFLDGTGIDGLVEMLATAPEGAAAAPAGAAFSEERI